MKWDEKKWRDEAKEWLAQPVNKQMFWTDIRDDLDKFLNGAIMPLGGVSFDCKQMANWYNNLAIANHLDHFDEALDYLIKHTQYIFEGHRIMARANIVEPQKHKKGRISFNRYGICLSRLIALGYFCEADRLLEELRRGLQNFLFLGKESTSVTPFIAELYADFKGQPISFEGFEARRAPAYQKLIKLLRSENTAEVSLVLQEACDYHVARAQASNDEVDYEFDDDLDRIHPAEVLAFLRLRQKLGLPMPDVKHPILFGPFGKLNEPKPFPADDYLNRVAQAAGVLPE